MKVRFLSILVWLLIGTGMGLAQTISFTYQGKLNDGGTPANASYDMQFRLFDAASAGNQIGAAQTKTNVETTNGIFTIQLDFPNAFPGADRFLEISVSPAGLNNYTTLAPRQKITSAPYAIRASNANLATNSAQLGGVAANQFVQTNDARLSDARNPLPGSDNYIQNTGAAQANANFNIGGTGKANILEATTQFNLNGNRFLSAPENNNLFAGFGTGASHTTGSSNSFFGINAGNANTTGRSNSFFGFTAGYSNTSGQVNSFFGTSSGQKNTSGEGNSFFGWATGNNNTTGGYNSFFGYTSGFHNTIGIFNAAFGAESGKSNTTGNNNSFFGTFSGSRNTTGNENVFMGDSAGRYNTTGSYNTYVGRNAGNQVIDTTGSHNSFFGWQAGDRNTTGSNNTALGSNANFSSNNLTYATVIGSGAQVATSNTIVLGRSADTVQIPGSSNIIGTLSVNTLDASIVNVATFNAATVNAGTQFNLGGSRILFASAGNLFTGFNAGKANTSGSYNSYFGNESGKANTIGEQNSFFGESAGLSNTTGKFNTFIGRAAGGLNTTGSNNIFIGAGATNSSLSTQISNSIVIGTNVTASTSNTILLGNEAQTTIIPGNVMLQAGNNCTNPTNCIGTVSTFSVQKVFKGLIANSLVTRDLGNYIPSSQSHLCFRPISVSSNDGGYGITNCSSSFSSAENKFDMKPFSGGLEIIKSLKPVAFKWKADGTQDFGLNAEDVAEIAPQFTVRDDKGEVTDIKENSLNVVFINAFKQQQEQIEKLLEQNRQQQQQIDELKKLICLSNAENPVCKSK
ncbi:MAG: tail fiber domain-containing protein [Acidobacteriota bacterium]|nr:tail fiber domain-containing protein [Acidobacteriota bacterium]